MVSSGLRQTRGSGGAQLPTSAAGNTGSIARLLLLIRKMATDKVLADLKGLGGVLMKAAFDDTKEAALREALAAVQTEVAAMPLVAT